MSYAHVPVVGSFLITKNIFGAFKPHNLKSSIVKLLKLGLSDNYKDLTP